MATPKELIEQVSQEAERRKNAYFEGLEKQKIRDYRAGREQDLATGRARGEEIFGNQALGRVSSDRSADVADILARRKEALKGYNSQEQQAQREQALQEVLRGQQAGARDLARQQSRAGVRGALAGAQQSAFQQATQKQLADQERQLYLANLAQQQQNLNSYEQSVTGAESGELARQQYNIDQANKELLGKLSTELGYGSLGAAERGAAIQSVLGDKQLSASKDIAAQQGKK